MARNWSDDMRFRSRIGSEPWRGPMGRNDYGRTEPGLMRDYGSTQVGAGEGYWSAQGQNEEERYDRSDYGGGRDYAAGDEDRPSRRYREEERHFRPRRLATQDYGGRADDAERYHTGPHYFDRGPRDDDRQGDYARSSRYGGEHGRGYETTSRRHGLRPDERRYAVDDNRRDFWARAGDEVASWFGDNDAERRREMDHHRGRGPKNYTRSTDRIREDVCDCLSEDWVVDASDVEVDVKGTEVTLAGTVPTRDQRRRAEDLSESISGVTHVQNNLRVAPMASPRSSHGAGAVNKASSATDGSSGPGAGNTIKAA